MSIATDEGMGTEDHSHRRPRHRASLERSVQHLWQMLRDADFIASPPLQEPVYHAVTPKNFAGRELRGTNFNDHTLEHANFMGCDLTASCFQHAQLQHANVNNTMLLGVNMSHANARDMQCEESDLTGVVAYETDFSYGWFLGAILRDIQANDGCFAYAKMLKVDWEYANLTRADFTHADMRYGLLRYANCEGACFVGADLRGCDLSYARNLKPKQLAKAANLSEILIDKEDKHMLSVLAIARSLASRTTG